jgi:hypothetical protein
MHLCGAGCPFRGGGGGHCAGVGTGDRYIGALFPFSLNFAMNLKVF